MDKKALCVYMYSEHSQQLRGTILDLAVRGMLVRRCDQIRDSASELLYEIAKRRKEVVDQKCATKSLPAIQASDAPFPIPQHWVWVRLQNILDGDSQNGFSGKPNDDPSGIPILRISAGTVRDDALVAEEEHKLIGGIPAQVREKFSLKKGDLLACRFNGNRGFVGRLSVFQNYLGIDPIYPDKLIRIRLFTDLTLPALLRYFMNSSLIRTEIEQHCATTVGNWGISATDLKSVPVPLPPIDEQRRIEERLDELMTICSRLELQLAQSSSIRSALLESVLHQALSSVPSATSAGAC